MCTDQLVGDSKENATNSTHTGEVFSKTNELAQVRFKPTTLPFLSLKKKKLLIFMFMWNDDLAHTVTFTMYMYMCGCHTYHTQLISTCTCIRSLSAIKWEGQRSCVVLEIESR